MASLHNPGTVNEKIVLLRILLEDISRFGEAKTL